MQHIHICAYSIQTIDVQKDEVFPDGTVVMPQRKILQQSDMIIWRKSEAYQGALEFIKSLNEGVTSRKCTQEHPISEVEIPGWNIEFK